MVLPYGNRWLLAIGKLFTNAAKRLGGDAEVGSNLALGHALCNGRICFEETQVSLFGGGAQGRIDPALVGNEPVFKQYPEETVELWNLLEQSFLRASLEKQQLRILESIDVIFTRLTRQCTVGFADPPVFDRKLHNMLFSFVVNGIAAQATFHNEGI